MGAFSVPLSSLAVQAMTTVALSPAQLPAGGVEPAPPRVPDQALVADVPPTFLNGFQVEGGAEVSVLVGDAESYRKHVERFFTLSQSMERARSSFSRSVATTLEILGRRRREAPRRAAASCPSEDIAKHYRQARKSADSYLALGAELSSERDIIVELDSLGETASLTSDLRAKVKQVAKIFDRAEVDLREMRASFMVQLQAELRHHRCQVEELVMVASEQAAHPTATVAAKGRPDATEPSPDDVTLEVVPATTVTFYVDNRACAIQHAVYLDGVLLGEVTGNQRAAFQALAGSHSICLLPEGDPAACGDPGTVRAAYFHSGWSMTLHCPPAQP